MPKISYQEIVTADVSESGTVTHEWEYKDSYLSHNINGVLCKDYSGADARKMWIILCRNK